MGKAKAPRRLADNEARAVLRTIRVSPQKLNLVAALIRGKKVMVGAIDVASKTIETPEEVAATLRNALRFVDADKLYPCTNCGMAPLPRDVASGKLKALSAGAEIVRGELEA